VCMFVICMSSGIFLNFCCGGVMLLMDIGVDRDAYGFAVRPQHLQRYREYANIYQVCFASFVLKKNKLNSLFSCRGSC
jgi:hypothetical protein